MNYVYLFTGKIGCILFTALCGMATVWLINRYTNKQERVIDYSTQITIYSIGLWVFIFGIPILILDGLSLFDNVLIIVVGIVCSVAVSLFTIGLCSYGSSVRYRNDSNDESFFIAVVMALLVMFGATCSILPFNIPISYSKLDNEQRTYAFARSLIAKDLSFVSMDDISLDKRMESYSFLRKRGFDEFVYLDLIRYLKDSDFQSVIRKLDTIIKEEDNDFLVMFKNALNGTDRESLLMFDPDLFSLTMAWCGELSHQVINDIAESVDVSRVSTTFLLNMEEKYQEKSLGLVGNCDKYVLSDVMYGVYYYFPERFKIREPGLLSLWLTLAFCFFMFNFYLCVKLGKY